MDTTTKKQMAQRLRQMRRLYTIGVPKAEIARRFGMSRQRAHQLLGNKEPKQ